MWKQTKTMENNDIKQKVIAIVDSYVRNYKEEFTNFRAQMKAYRSNLNTKWAELKGTDVMVRELIRMPETVNALLKIGLSDAEYLEFREQKMQFWFGNHFPDFKVTEGKL